MGYCYKYVIHLTYVHASVHSSLKPSCIQCFCNVSFRIFRFGQLQKKLGEKYLRYWYTWHVGKVWCDAINGQVKSTSKSNTQDTQVQFLLLLSFWFWWSSWWPLPLLNRTTICHYDYYHYRISKKMLLPLSESVVHLCIPQEETNGDFLPGFIHLLNLFP